MLIWDVEVEKKTRRQVAFLPSTTRMATESHSSTNGHDITPSTTSTTTPSRDQLARHAYARSILGHDLFKKLDTAKILVVGAGGIGCELLKNLVLVGFGDIEIVSRVRVGVRGERERRGREEIEKRDRRLRDRDRQTALSLSQSTHILTLESRVRHLQITELELQNPLITLCRVYLFHPHPLLTFPISLSLLSLFLASLSDRSRHH